jgi:dTMP kinase
VPGPYLIAFEGIEGAGKSTQLARAVGLLTAGGYDVVASREPGGTAVGERIRALVLEPAFTTLTPVAELYLYLAARNQHVREVIKPALAAGKTVLVDRYVHSTLAYQGYGLGITLGGPAAPPAVQLARLSERCDEAAEGLWPDLVLVFDVPPEVGLARRGAAPPDRIEGRTLAFHRRVREGFLALAAADPGRVKVIDASASEDDVAAAVEWNLSALLP